jgi:hypothetical protein
MMGVPELKALLRLALADVEILKEQKEKAAKNGPGLDYGWLRVHLLDVEIARAEARVREINRLSSEANYASV